MDLPKLSKFVLDIFTPVDQLVDRVEKLQQRVHHSTNGQTAAVEFTKIFGERLASLKTGTDVNGDFFAPGEEEKLSSLICSLCIVEPKCGKKLDAIFNNCFALIKQFISEGLDGEDDIMPTVIWSVTAFQALIGLLRAAAEKDAKWLEAASNPLSTNTSRLRQAALASGSAAAAATSTSTSTSPKKGQSSALTKTMRANADALWRRRVRLALAQLGNQNQRRIMSVFSTALATVRHECSPEGLHIFTLICSFLELFGLLDTLEKVESADTAKYYAGLLQNSRDSRLLPLFEVEVRICEHLPMSLRTNFIKRLSSNLIEPIPGPRVAKSIIPLLNPMLSRGESRTYAILVQKLLAYLKSLKQRIIDEEKKEGDNENENEERPSHLSLVSGALWVPALCSAITMDVASRRVLDSVKDFFRAEVVKPEYVAVTLNSVLDIKSPYVDELLAEQPGATPEATFMELAVLFCKNVVRLTGYLPPATKSQIVNLCCQFVSKRLFRGRSHGEVVEEACLEALLRFSDSVVPNQLIHALQDALKFANAENNISLSVFPSTMILDDEGDVSLLSSLPKDLVAKVEALGATWIQEIERHVENVLNERIEIKPITAPSSSTAAPSSSSSSSSSSSTTAAAAAALASPSAPILPPILHTYRPPPRRLIWPSDVGYAVMTHCTGSGEIVVQSCQMAILLFLNDREGLRATWGDIAGTFTVKTALLEAAIAALTAPGQDVLRRVAGGSGPLSDVISPNLDLVMDAENALYIRGVHTTDNSTNNNGTSGHTTRYNTSPMHHRPASAVSHHHAHHGGAKYATIVAAIILRIMRKLKQCTTKEIIDHCRAAYHRSGPTTTPFSSELVVEQLAALEKNGYLRLLSVGNYEYVARNGEEAAEDRMSPSSIGGGEGGISRIPSAINIGTSLPPNMGLVRVSSYNTTPGGLSRVYSNPADICIASPKITKREECEVLRVDDLHEVVLGLLSKLSEMLNIELEASEWATLLAASDWDEEQLYLWIADKGLEEVLSTAGITFPAVVPPAESFFNCPICFCDKIPVAEGMCGSCGHLCCAECMTGMCESAIRDPLYSSPISIRCASCRQPLKQSVILSALSEASKEKYLSSFRTAIVSSFVNSKPLSATCDCGRSFICRDTPVVVQCTCKKAFCVGCKRRGLENNDKGHGPATCEELQSWKSLVLSGPERFRLLRVKPCPQCGTPVNKCGCSYSKVVCDGMDTCPNQACDHITCPCGHEWCWACSGNWRDHNYRVHEQRLDRKERFLDFESKYKQHKRRLAVVAKTIDTKKPPSNPQLVLVATEIIEAERALSNAVVHCFFASAKESALLQTHCGLVQSILEKLNQCYEAKDTSREALVLAASLRKARDQLCYPLSCDHRIGVALSALADVPEDLASALDQRLKSVALPLGIYRWNQWIINCTTEAFTIIGFPDEVSDDQLRTRVREMSDPSTYQGQPAMTVTISYEIAAHRFVEQKAVGFGYRRGINLVAADLKPLPRDGCFVISNSYYGVVLIVSEKRMLMFNIQYSHQSLSFTSNVNDGCCIMRSDKHARLFCLETSKSCKFSRIPGFTPAEKKTKQRPSVPAEAPETADFTPHLPYDAMLRSTLMESLRVAGFEWLTPFLQRPQYDYEE